MFRMIELLDRQIVWRAPRTPAARLPALQASAAEFEVWIDFDGTITQLDVLDELIRGFASSDRWRQTEARWMAGETGSFECLREEFEVLSVDEPTLAAFVATIPIDPGAGPLFSLLRTAGVPFTILSDGVDSFIRSVLERGALGTVAVRANQVSHRDRRLQLICPHRFNECESRAAHCKCRSAELLAHPRRLSIYIGDGRSDLCPARKADIVFAKGTLAQLLADEGRQFHRFDSLSEVADALRIAWSIT
ncbi:MAG: phosphoserine phosphatase [Phycisphaerales bacterium]|nr:phosphoserine phosphatase [Phycisphaerales bacterium]